MYSPFICREMHLSEKNDNVKLHWIKSCDSGEGAKELLIARSRLLGSRAWLHARLQYTTMISGRWQERISLLLLLLLLWQLCGGNIKSVFYSMFWGLCRATKHKPVVSGNERKRHWSAKVSPKGPTTKHLAGTRARAHRNIPPSSRRSAQQHALCGGG